MMRDAPASGASPRVRGKRRSAVQPRVAQRCIPACAGEAQGGPVAHRRAAVHPRVCGGSELRNIHDLLAAGASPRVRGKPGVVPRRAGGGRCIPACAGEALLGGLALRRPQVHPRVCGGSVAWPRSNSDSEGASPRVRGKPRPVLEIVAQRRCIPACAGEAAARRRSAPTSRVHPRVCGGSLASLDETLTNDGASPRVRGKRRRRRRRGRQTRCIPACAGEASTAYNVSAASGVHPRVCGGSPAMPSRATPCRGCIPACAGEAA